MTQYRNVEIVRLGGRYVLRFETDEARYSTRLDDNGQLATAILLKHSHVRWRPSPAGRPPAGYFETRTCEITAKRWRDVVPRLLAEADFQAARARIAAEEERVEAERVAALRAEQAKEARACLAIVEREIAGPWTADRLAVNVLLALADADYAVQHPNGHQIVVADDRPPAMRRTRDVR